MLNKDHQTVKKYMDDLDTWLFLNPKYKMSYLEWATKYLKTDFSVVFLFTDEYRSTPDVPGEWSVGWFAKEDQYSV